MALLQTAGVYRLRGNAPRRGRLRYGLAVEPPPPQPPPPGTGSAMLGSGTLAGARFDFLPTVGLIGALNAADTVAYDGLALPSNGAAVDFLKARAGLYTDAVAFGAANLPTFGQDAGGTGRHGLRFTAASSQVLQWPGLVPYFNQADMGFTLIAVFRFAATLSGMQTICGLSVDGAFQDYRQTIRLKADGSGFYMNAQTGSGTDTFSAAVASAPAANTTYIAVGRHGTPSGTNANRLAVRISAATSTNTNGSTQDMDFNSTGAMTQAFVGAHRRGGTLKEFLNGWLMAAFVYDRELSDTEVTAAITALRAEWGVS